MFLVGDWPWGDGSERTYRERNDLDELFHISSGSSESGKYSAIAGV
jgi:hypothetical protein